MNLLYLLMPLAAWDAVAVIVRPEKALVQVQEPGTATRLRSFVRALSGGSSFLLTTPDSSLKLECGADEAAAGCVIRFLPGANAHIDAKRVSGNADEGELGVTIAPPEFGASFLGSNGDRLTIRLHEARLELEATKR